MCLLGWHWLPHHVDAIFNEQPPDAFVVVSNAREKPIGRIGVPAGDHTGGISDVVDGDDNTSSREIRTNLKMYGVIMLCNLHPVGSYPPAYSSRGSVPIVAFLRSDVHRKPCTQLCPV